MEYERKESFGRYLKQKSIGLELLILTVFYVSLYFIITAWYPFPDTLSDSWNYMLHAQKNTYAIFRPIGYSHMLQFFHYFSTSIHAIFIFQLFLLYLSNTILVFSLKYIFNINGMGGYILSALIALSPCAIYMSNMIMSDSVFASFTSLFLTCVVWVLYRPKLYVLYIPIPFILFLILNIRYSGLFYPILLIPFFFVNNRKWFFVPSLFVLVSIMFFNVYNKSQMKKTIGVKTVLGGFAGWQLANNVMHMFPHIKPEDYQFKKHTHTRLHQLISADSVYVKKTLENRPATAEFMWNKNSPLKKHLAWHMNTAGTFYVKEWVTAGMEMEEYSKIMIKKEPMAYLKYYLWPSTKSFFWADPGVMLQHDTLKPDLKDEWFFTYYKLDKKQNFGANKDPFKHFFSKFMREGNFFLWILTFSAIGFMIVFFKKIRLSSAQKKIFIFLLLFSILYCAFTILATPTEMRYIIPVTTVQYLVLILAVANAGYLVKGLLKKRKGTPE